MLFHCGLMQYNDTYVDHHILNEKLYTENLRSSNTNPTKNQGWIRVLRKGKQFHGNACRVSIMIYNQLVKKNCWKWVQFHLIVSKT